MNVRLVNTNWNNDLPIYSNKSVLESFDCEYGWIAGYENEAQEPICFIPYILKKKFLFFRYVQFQSSTIWLTPDKDNNKEREFLHQALSLLKQKHVDFIVEPPSHAVFQNIPDGAEYAEYGTYFIDLNQSEDELWKDLHAKYRNNINKAIKRDVIVLSGLNYQDTAYELIFKTLQKSNISFFTKGQFNSYLSSFGPNVKIYVSFCGDEPQSCVIIPFSKHSAYCIFGGSIDNPVIGAIKYMHWHAMLEFKQLGVKRYDFVGARLSPQPGSKQDKLLIFKQRFGGTLVRGYLWKYTCRMPWKKHIYYFYMKHLKGRSDIIDEINSLQG